MITPPCSQVHKTLMYTVYFFSVFTKCHSQQFNFNESILPENSLNEIDFTESDVFHALTNLNSNKATGIDTISPCVLKTVHVPLWHHCSNYLLPA